MGKAVAQALDLDPENKRDKARITALIKVWLKSGALVEITADDEKRMPRKFIQVRDI